MSHSASPPFLINDPDHAPFGREWLRGLTPARIGVLAAVCAIISIQFMRQPLLKGEYWEALNAGVYAWSRNFVGAVPLFLLLIRTEIATRAWRQERRVAALLGAVLAGAFAFALVRGTVRYLHNTIADDARYWEVAVSHFSKALTLGAVFAGLLWFVVREREAARSLQRIPLANGNIARQISEAQLRLLQAQIERQFLFNSLASVKRLYEKQPAKGRELLRNLREYLRIASPRGKRSAARLGDEVSLATAFLAIFQLRMGERLRVHVDVPPELRSAALPPLMLGTLVENAIKHGISSRSSGGMIALTARRDGSFLEVVVRDDGVGFRRDWGPGIGLANTRARLETLYPGMGILSLTENPEGGVKATVRIPYEAAAT